MNHVICTACCPLSRYILSDHRRKFSFCLCDQGVQFFGVEQRVKLGFSPNPDFYLVQQGLPFQCFPLCIFGSLKTGFFVQWFFSFHPLGMHSYAHPWLWEEGYACWALEVKKKQTKNSEYQLIKKKKRKNIVTKWHNLKADLKANLTNVA